MQTMLELYEHKCENFGFSYHFVFELKARTGLPDERTTDGRAKGVMRPMALWRKNKLNVGKIKCSI